MHDAQIMFDDRISFAQRGHFQAYRPKGVSPILLLSVSRALTVLIMGSVPGTFKGPPRSTELLSKSAPSRQLQAKNRTSAEAHLLPAGTFTCGPDRARHCEMVRSPLSLALSFDRRWQWNAPCVACPRAVGIGMDVGGSNAPTVVRMPSAAPAVDVGCRLTIESRGRDPARGCLPAASSASSNVAPPAAGHHAGRTSPAHCPISAGYSSSAIGTACNSGLSGAKRRSGPRKATAELCMNVETRVDLTPVLYLYELLSIFHITPVCIEP